ncbi:MULTISPECIES: four helix bundle protein [Aequorivita]|uniref:Four helix bundle protein n=1 Tax=Aequorivita iocasae TaxID=2803865 RepID=A0ABX7DR57_9FLAO|nr:MULTISPECIES: four helix bundle protein [Aequorivita]QQX75947.1 four helix bundle protein [Aequorivita iocasae]UCA55409.1 four helix bundle protein [Aequorivita sp. F7]
MAENFEKLHCWQACYDLKTYLKTNISEKLPKTEKFELYSQILRASRSSTANIAEGWGRYHYKENINFLRFSRGSVAEILDHCIEAKDCDYINLETLNEIRSKTEKCIQLINGYIRYLQNRNDEK